MTSQEHPEPAAGARRRGRRRPTWGAVLWIAILCAIGIVQVLRLQWFDALVLLAMTGALAADAWGLLPNPSSGPRIGRGALLSVAAPLAVGLCLLPRHGVAMVVLVGAVGAASLALSWPQRGAAREAWPRGLRRLAIAWAVILVVGCVWELVEFILGRVAPDLVSVAFSNIVDPVVSTLPGRIGFVVLWAVGGVFLLRRGRR
jgi:hypothetical protein